MDNFDIKLARKDDLKEFIPLIDVEESGLEFINLIEDKDENLYLLKLDDKNIGIACIDIEDDEFYFYIYIFKEYRNKGYGTFMLKYIEDKFKNSSSKQLLGAYNMHCELSKHFLTKNGYSFSFGTTCMKFTGTKFEEPDLPIRQYKDEDFDEAFLVTSEALNLSRLRTGCFPDSKPDQPKEDSREKWKNTANDRFVIEMNGEIVGFSMIDEDELGIVTIKISHHNQGLGKKLVKYMTNLLIERGVNEPILWCLIGNDNARHIYKSLGYNEIIWEGYAEKKF